MNTFYGKVKLREAVEKKTGKISDKCQKGGRGSDQNHDLIFL